MPTYISDTVQAGWFKLLEVINGTVDDRHPSPEEILFRASNIQEARQLILGEEFSFIATDDLFETPRIVEYFHSLVGPRRTLHLNFIVLSYLKSDDCIVNVVNGLSGIETSERLAHSVGTEIQTRLIRPYLTPLYIHNHEASRFPDVQRQCGYRANTRVLQRTLQRDNAYAGYGTVINSAGTAYFVSSSKVKATIPYSESDNDKLFSILNMFRDNLEERSHA